MDRQKHTKFVVAGVLLKKRAEWRPFEQSYFVWLIFKYDKMLLLFVIFYSTKVIQLKTLHCVNHSCTLQVIVQTIKRVHIAAARAHKTCSIENLFGISINQKIKHPYSKLNILGVRSFV